MRIRGFAAAGMAVVLMCGFGAGVARANRSIGLTPEEGERGNVKVESRALTFALEGSEIICELEQKLTVAKAISKSVGASAGSVLEAEFRNCRGATLRVNKESLPWAITYQSFTGTLPSIREINAQYGGVSVLWRAALLECLYGGTLQFRTTSSPIAAIVFSERSGLSLTRSLGGLFCPGEGEEGPALIMRGSASVRPTLRMDLNTFGCAPGEAKVDEALQRQEASSVTVPMAIVTPCERTSITAISVERGGESVAIGDERERLRERTYGEGATPRYDLRLTAREGARVVEAIVTVTMAIGERTTRATTRVRFRDL